MTRNEEFFPGLGNPAFRASVAFNPTKLHVALGSGFLKGLEHGVKENRGTLRLGKDPLPNH